MPTAAVLGTGWQYLLKPLFKEHWSVLACFYVGKQFLGFIAAGEPVSQTTQQPCPAGGSWACSLPS